MSIAIFREASGISRFGIASEVEERLGILVDPEVEALSVLLSTGVSVDVPSLR